MNEPFFTGTATALVTPFINGAVNYPMLEQLLRRQIDAGIQTVVIAGTTGEAPTLSDQEKVEMFARCKTYAGSACRIIAGTGSNATAHAIDLSRAAEKAGADGLLVVSPYYNKATPEGLLAHYTAIARSVHIPVILYNVPGRTGVDIPVEVYRKLAAIPGIAGVKEASTDIRKITQIRHACPDSFTVWTGNDDLTVPAIALGAQGVISVASNLCPGAVAAMTAAALAGDADTAASLQTMMQPLVELLFREVNPIPLKTAMQLLGYDCGPCRLPLTNASPALKEALRHCLLEDPETNTLHLI